MAWGRACPRRAMSRDVARRRATSCDVPTSRDIACAWSSVESSDTRRDRFSPGGQRVRARGWFGARARVERRGSGEIQTSRDVVSVARQRRAKFCGVSNRWDRDYISLRASRDVARQVRSRGCDRARSCSCERARSRGCERRAPSRIVVFTTTPFREALRSRAARPLR